MKAILRIAKENEIGTRITTINWNTTQYNEMQIIVLYCCIAFAFKYAILQYNMYEDFIHHTEINSLWKVYGEM